MAWYNPATWTAVDNLQGQNSKPGGSVNVPYAGWDGTNRYDTLPNKGYSVTPPSQQTGGNDYGAYDPVTGTWQDEGVGGPTAEQQAAAAARQGIMDQKSGYLNSLNEGIGQYGNRYGSNIGRYIEDLTSGQRNIDSMGARNELARNQGQAGVLGMVGRGIKSSGVMLGNRNAGDSSAAGALAGAYGQLGTRQMASVGNQYELGNADIMNQQQAFDTSKRRGMEDLQMGKNEYVTGLLNEVQSTMATLNAQLMDASLPDRIAIEQEKEAVRQRANQALQGYDQQLTSGVGGVQASSTDARRAEANRLQGLGTDLGAGAFDFTQQAPMQFQGNAPSGGNLPIFTLPRRRR